MRAIFLRPLSVVLLAALVGLPGCSHTPGVSNGSVSVCYRAIPVGRAAVHDSHARLIGVHRIPLDNVRSHLPAASRDQLAAEDDLAVCEMTFRGSFGPGQVDMAPAGQAGSYALVLVSSLRLHLVAAVVLPHLPRGFGGRTV
jgi:hypothetical protein